MKSRAEQLFLFSVTMTLVFGGLIFWSLMSGTQIVNTKLPESLFSKEEVKNAPITFALDEAGPLKMTVSGPTLDNSWLWVKAVVLDAKDVAIHEHDFNLSYYHGPDWSEGNRSDDWTFRLPAGEYKVLIYGENDRVSRGVAQRGRSGDVLKVEIQTGVVLMRYFALGFITFLILSFLANSRKADALKRNRAQANRRELFS